jgi:hypothetical protein
LCLNSGCAYTFKRQPATQARIVESARDEAQAASFALDRARRDIAVARAIVPTNAPLASAEASSDLASRLARRTESLLGPPSKTQWPRVHALLSSQADQRAHAEAVEQRREAGQSAMITQAKEQTAALVAKGMVYEQEQNRSIIARAWHWAIGTVGLGGFIAFCVLFPAALPVMGQAIGWLIGKIPKLSSIIGMVGVKSYERAVTAIQEIKQAAKLSGQSAAEDLARKVAAENTAKDAALVAHVKNSLGYVEAKKSWNT